MSPEPIMPNAKNYPKSIYTQWAQMRYWLPIFFIFNFCGLDIEDPTPPSPPVWVQKSLPDEWPERGIDAHESGGIYLEWEINPEENIAAYIIYRSEYINTVDSLSDYTWIHRVKSVSNTPLEFIDSDITPNTQYYYKLKADDLSDNRSGYSDSCGYLVLPQITINQMEPSNQLENLDSNRLLYWHYTNSIQMENYCLTLLDLQNDLILRTVLSPVNYVNGSESWRVPDSIILMENQLYKWRIDTGANYSQGIESAGSESPWATFFLQ
jgi:hypothetical protein